MDEAKLFSLLVDLHREGARQGPGGVLAVSEITWLRPDPPDAIRQYWESGYPGIATAPEKISVLERAGYDLLGYFTLPSSCWLENCYEPTQARLGAFLERHAGEPAAVELVEMERREISLYKRYQDYFSYGFYVARTRKECVASAWGTGLVGGKQGSIQPGFCGMGVQ